MAAHNQWPARDGDRNPDPNIRSILSTIRLKAVETNRGNLRKVIN